MRGELHCACSIPGIPTGWCSVSSKGSAFRSAWAPGATPASVWSSLRVRLHQGKIKIDRNNYCRKSRKVNRDLQRACETFIRFGFFLFRSQKIALKLERFFKKTCAWKSLGMLLWSNRDFVLHSLSPTMMRNLQWRQRRIWMTLF